MGAYHVRAHRVGRILSALHNTNKNIISLHYYIILLFEYDNRIRFAVSGLSNASIPKFFCVRHVQIMG